MATVIENENGRRMIRVSTDDVISLVREYQTLTGKVRDVESVRKILSANPLFLPEDV
ncbi:hypothetical protein IJ732_02575 [bacterium]|nr:hypothetical protein [bacterium]